MDLNRLPRYDELPLRPHAPKGAAWGVFGDDDQLGTVNFLTPQKVLEAARLVRQGKVFALNLPLHLPDPPLYGRQRLRHHLLDLGGVGRDDYLESFWLQASSQWDGLRHIRHPRYGFYNGVSAEEVVPGGGPLGIEHWARRGIVGRGVLLDVARHLEARGRPLDPRSATLITPAHLEACAHAQGVELRPADILLVRTGWLGWYLQLSQEEREALAHGEGQGPPSPGLGPAEEMARFLWDRRIAAVAADNPALEAWPPKQETGFLHYFLIPYLGMPIGELWYLEELAADCAQDGIYEFLLTSAPLHLVGGVGSPPNALAIK